jgi:hypothetical protein
MKSQPCDEATPCDEERASLSRFGALETYLEVVWYSLASARAGGTTTPAAFGLSLVGGCMLYLGSNLE